MKEVFLISIIILPACTVLSHAKTKALATWVSGSDTKDLSGGDSEGLTWHMVAKFYPSR